MPERKVRHMCDPRHDSLLPGSLRIQAVQVLGGRRAKAIDKDGPIDLERPSVLNPKRAKCTMSDVGNDLVEMPLELTPQRFSVLETETLARSERMI